MQTFVCYAHTSVSRFQLVFFCLIFLGSNCSSTSSGQLQADHPLLFILMFLLSQGPILRPIMTVIGFGPLGPVKGGLLGMPRRLR